MALKRARSGFLAAIEARIDRAREEEELSARALSRTKNAVKHETLREQSERELIKRQLQDIEHQRAIQRLEGIGTWREVDPVDIVYSVGPNGELIKREAPRPLPPPTGRPVVLDPRCPICQQRIKPSRFDYHRSKCEPRYTGRQIDYLWRDSPGS